MGLGTPPQLLELIARGMDMFDCVLPTRLARNGTAFTAGGTLNLKNAEFAMQKEPIEEKCSCPTCREFSRGLHPASGQSGRDSRASSDHAAQSPFLSGSNEEGAGDDRERNVH